MDNIPVNNENVEVLLQRFFDGETSCAEERALETYFCSGATLPPEVECYRDMFGWYAQAWMRAGFRKLQRHVGAARRASSYGGALLRHPLLLS